MGSCVSCRVKQKSLGTKIDACKTNRTTSESLPSPFDASVYSDANVHKKNDQEYVTESDFLIGVKQMGPIEQDVALSAFKIFDINNNHYLSVLETRAAFEYLHKLTDY